MFCNEHNLVSYYIFSVVLKALTSGHILFLLFFRFKEERFREIHIGKFIDSTGFRLTIMAAIFINSIIIGIQTDKHLVSSDT